MSTGNSSQRNLVRVGGALAAGAGSLALLGWGAGLPFLTSLGSGNIPMAPSTALLFVLYGIATFLRARVPLSPGAYWLGVAANSAGALIALLLFVLSSLGIRPEAEHLGLRVAGTVGDAPVGHMSPVTALCFLLVSLSFLASLPSAASRPWRSRVAWWSAGVLLATCFVLLLAYLYGTPLLYVGSFIPPAATTSIAFAALGIALLALAGLQVWPQSDLAGPDPRASYPLALTFVLLAVGIVTVGGLYYRDYEKRYRAGVEQQLSAIAALKVSELVQYRQERLGDGFIFFENAAFSALVRRAFDNPNAREAQTELRTWLGKYQEHYQHDRVFLLDARGAEWMAAPEGRAAVASVIARRAPEVLQSGEVAFQDFYRDEHDQKVYLTILVPILDGRDGRRALGILGLRIDPETYLYPFLRRWPTLSRTAETLLVRRDGNDALFLNELRFKEHTALALRVPLESREQPAVKAALGHEGIVGGLDYRGVPVVAAVRAVPGSPWYLVARMDVAEVNAPLRERLWVTIVLVGGLLAGAVAGLGLVWRQQRVRFYQEKYQTEKALGESRALLEAIVNATPDSVFAKDPQGRYLLLNAAAERFTGKSQAATLGQDDTFLFPPAEAAAVMEGDRKVMDAEGPTTFEQDFTDADGTMRTVLTTKGPLFDASGALIGLFGVTRNITERKRAEDRHRLQSAALAAAANAIVLTDRDGRIEWANQAFAALTGYSLEEAVGRTPRELIGSGRHDRAFYKTMWDTILDGRVWYGEIVNRRKDGTLYEEEMTITPIRDEAGAITHFVAVKQDVTDRNRVAEALHESERHFRALIEHALDVTLLLGPDGRFRYASPSIQRISGDRPEDLVGTNALDRLHPDDLPAAQRLLSAGGEVPGSTASTEFRFRHRDGSWLTFEATARNLLHDPAVNGIILNARDATERRQSEAQQRRLQAQLVQSEKLAAMGQLLAGVAHELNNPLSVVIGHAELLRRTTDPGIVARAQKLGAAAERCGRIVKNFLALARQHEPERQTMELNGVVRDVTELLAYQLRVDDVEVVATLADDLPPISADPHQLQQVVVNLVTNAHQAMQQAPRPRRLTLTTRRSAGSDRVCLEVEDTGPGITPEVEARLFEPFFTTKPVGQGSGLGLSICKGIVESHGGTIVVEGRPGWGARFTVELPLGASARIAIADGHEVPAPRGIAILVVDDEPEVARLMAEVVTGEGCRVATAGNGREALDLLAREAFDVVITDLKMPEMDGMDLYREIAQRYPALRGRVVLVTGDTLSPSTAEFLQETQAPSVRKPFSATELRSAVHAVREGRPPARTS